MKVLVTKAQAKLLTWALVGLLYFPIYLVFWVLRIVARLLLGISYIMTFEKRLGVAVLKSILSWEYERTH